MRCISEWKSESQKHLHFELPNTVVDYEPFPLNNLYTISLALVIPLSPLLAGVPPSSFGSRVRIRSTPAEAAAAQPSVLPQHHRSWRPNHDLHRSLWERGAWDEMEPGRRVGDWGALITKSFMVCPYAPDKSDTMLQCTVAQCIE